MAAADRVLCTIQVSREVIEVLRFNQVHALLVEAFDGAMNHWLVVEFVRETEPLAPMAEVARDDEDGALVEEQRQQKLGVRAVLGLGDVSDHQRH